jgi:hypothetical protein
MHSATADVTENQPMLHSVHVLAPAIDPAAHAMQSVSPATGW